MRKAVSAAIVTAFLAMAAYDIGCYVRGDYLGEEPARDMAVGLGALAVVAVAGWATGKQLEEGADSEC